MPTFHHGDLIGSTLLTTDETGNVQDWGTGFQPVGTGAPSLPGVGDRTAARTAFGEVLRGTGLEPEECQPGSPGDYEWAALGACDPASSAGCNLASPGGSAPQGFPRYQYAGAWGYETGDFAAADGVGGGGTGPGGGAGDPGRTGGDP